RSSSSASSYLRSSGERRSGLRGAWISNPSSAARGSRCLAGRSTNRQPSSGGGSPTTQGNRLNVLCGDVGGEGVFVPCGDFAAHAQRILAFAGSQHVEGAVLDDGEVEGGVVGSHAAFVVA